MIAAMLNSPFFGMGLCLVTYLAGKWIQNKTKSVLANPLLIAVAICIPVLLLLDIPYESFAKGADVINWMLGPVTALLALVLDAPVALVCLAPQVEHLSKCPIGLLRVRSRKWINDVTIKEET